MRDSITKHRIKNETTDAKTDEFELDNDQKIATITILGVSVRNVVR